MKRLFSVEINATVLLLICLSLVFCHSCSVRTIVPCDGSISSDSLNSFLGKPGLKVLDIGNSYTNDALALLPQVVENCGVNVNDMSLYKIIRGGASFKNWCDVYQDNDSNFYTFEHVVGSRLAEVPYWEEAGYRDGGLLRRILTDTEWDLIIIHQVSNYAPYYDLWRQAGEGGCLDDLLTILKEKQPNARIGFLLVHSYWDNYDKNMERSSLKRWQKIANSVKHLQKDYPIELVIPYGTAIENIRSSSLNNYYDLTKDGTHCGYGLCQYTAACCYYEALLAPRTGVSCYGTPANMDVSATVSDFPGVNVDKNNALIAQKAAILAIQDMYHCNNPEKN